MIETTRLILRPFQDKDVQAVYEYTNAQTVHCFHDMRFSSPEAAHEEVARRLEDAEYYFAICLKKSGEAIGEIFAHPEQTAPGDAAQDTFSPCWMLHPDHQGKGYAYEAACAYYDYLFSEKGARRIYAYTEDDNLPSQHLCEKLGMRREGLFREFVTFVNNPDGTPLYENTLQYAILKSEWIDRRRLQA